MTTMTEPTINLTDDFELLDEAFWENYVDADSGRKAMPQDGDYFLRLPDSIPETAFNTSFKDRDGKPFVSISLDPVTIVSEDEAVNGYEVRFLNVSTQPEQNFKKEGDAWKATGAIAASSATDLLLNFGVTERPKTLGELKQAFRELEGKTTPHPVNLVWKGKDKVATTRSQKYLKSKDFPTLGDGTRPNFIERKDEITGQTRRVWAGLELGRRGAAPRS